MVMEFLILSRNWLAIKDDNQVSGQIAVILFVAFILRITGLEEYGYNRDELATLQFSGQDFTALIFGPDFDNH